MDYGDGEVQQYTFDPMGNRLTKTVNGTPEGYTYNNANRLLTRGGQNYTNDPSAALGQALAGNTLTGGGRTMTWDASGPATLPWVVRQQRMAAGGGEEGGGPVCSTLGAAAPNSENRPQPSFPLM